MVEAILVFLFLHFARGRPQLVFASDLPELGYGVWLLARLGRTRELNFSVLHSIFFPLLMAQSCEKLFSSDNLPGESTAGDHN